MPCLCTHTSRTPPWLHVHRRQVPSLAPEPDNYWDSDDGPATPAAAREEEDIEEVGGGGAADEASLLRGLLGGSGLETLGQDWNEEEEWDGEDDEFLDDNADALDGMVDEDDEDAFLAQYDVDDDEEVCVCMCACVCVRMCVCLIIAVCVVCCDVIPSDVRG